MREQKHLFSHDGRRRDFLQEEAYARFKEIMMVVPTPIEGMRHVLGEDIPVAIYTANGTRVVYGVDSWIDRLPRTWSSSYQYRIEVEYAGSVHAAFGSTIEQAVSYLLGGVLGISLGDE